MWMVVGLGNPGPRYEATRHNIGFRVVEAFAGTDAFRARFHGRVAQLEIAGHKCVVLEPLTFMNESGRSVQAAAAFFRVPAEELLIVHDELDLPFGRLKLKLGGGEAGHNGLRSVSQHIGTKDYFRLRMGIGRERDEFAISGKDFVLDAFAPREAELLAGFIEQGVQAVRRLIQDGAEAAMNEINKKPGR